MFRQPRETSPNALKGSTASVGRPPTPPLTPAKTPFTLAIAPTVPPPTMAATKAKAGRPVPLPTIGRQPPNGSARPGGSAKKGRDKANGNIMSFFKTSEQETGLFVEEKGKLSQPTECLENMSLLPEEDTLNGRPATVEDGRFNEAEGSIKKQKTSLALDDDSMYPSSSVLEIKDTTKPETLLQRPSGPFLEDSDDDEQVDAVPEVNGEGHESGGTGNSHAIMESYQEDIEVQQSNIDDTSPNILERPQLVRDETSYGPEIEDFKDFEGLDDFDEDLFEEGDEYMERRYMEEQARLEAEEDEKDYDRLPPESTSLENDSTADGGLTCPMCATSLSGVSEQDAGVHVNNCLDGNPTPLPERKTAPSSTTTAQPESAIFAPGHQFGKPGAQSESTPPASGTQFLRPGRAPKPAQANPFVLGQRAATGGSAFSKLMSGHAEDAAWAEAAASEHASRGKPSYQRTCPFYKIMPGLSICVDAFRYGAVEGCQAYFLSHFHSDHYVGLTSNWSHGPIYSSKVTGNLVRQQLRVDPKYVVDLEFEQTVEVAGTKGVKVTMIPANHCPVSSLFLFEKVVGRKPNGEPRLQRILHCGDFRACRQHIEHPLLMPDVQDKVNGKTKEQKIDVCYLDTTYLNPKYAFPSQESVIKACADMCVSLSKHSADENDGWEQMKRQRAGQGMVKFIRKDVQAEVKEEADAKEEAEVTEEVQIKQEPEEGNNVQLKGNPNGSQQVLATANTPDIAAGRGRLLVIVGTYSIGKERICVGIAQALKSKIYAPPGKMRIVAALEDSELNALMTDNPAEAQVHMTPLFEIRAETLDEYLRDQFPHFTRAVGFRPTGWNYRPPNSRFIESPSVQTVLHSENWKSDFSMKDLVPQRGSISRASCFGVPYSEHSSFRELTMFCCALRIERVVPTVNVGSRKSREKMKSWVEKWLLERRKNGLFSVSEEEVW